MSEHSCTRREFFVGAAKVAAVVGVATILAPHAEAGEKKATSINVDLANPVNAPLAKVGGAIMVDNPKTPKDKIILYRKSNTVVTAVSSLCTHADGPLTLPDANGIMTCPWHKATFNLDGKVIKGPTSKPLKKYSATINGNSVIVKL